MEALSKVNNDQRWLMLIWFVGFGLFLAGALVLLAYAVVDLIRLYGLRNIAGWTFATGALLLIVAAAIDVPLAYIRRRQINH